MIFKGFLSHSNIVLDSPIGILCGVHIVLHTLELLTMKEAKKGPNVYIYIIIYTYRTPKQNKDNCSFPFRQEHFSLSLLESRQHTSRAFSGLQIWPKWMRRCHGHGKLWGSSDRKHLHETTWGTWKFLEHIMEIMGYRIKIWIPKMSICVIPK